MRLRLAPLVLSFVLFVPAALAQAAAESAPAPRKVSPAKDKLIREYLELSGAQETSKAMVAAMMSGMERPLRDLALQLTEAAHVPAGVDPEKVRQLQEGMVSRMQQRIVSLIGQPEFAGPILEIQVEVIDRFFSEAELREMIAFLNTPLGRKVIREMPAIMQEAAGGAQRELAVKMEMAGRQIGMEEAQRLMDELKALEP